jgi:hypothetical protein
MKQIRALADWNFDPRLLPQFGGREDCQPEALSIRNGRR